MIIVLLRASSSGLPAPYCGRLYGSCVRLAAAVVYAGRREVNLVGLCWIAEKG